METNEKKMSLGKKVLIGFGVLFFIGFLSNLGKDEKKEQIKSSSESTTTTSIPNKEIPEVEILKHNATFEESMDSYTIHCRVKNNTDKLIDYLDIKATFYDKDGNIVGTGLGNAANFAGGAEKTIDVIGLDIQNCEKYEVQVNNSF